MSNPFDYVNAINGGKDIIHGTDNDALAIKGYNAFLVNRQFSYFPDTIYAANELNQRDHLESDKQFVFYINIIRPRKRFSKWAKTEKNDDLVLVAEHYGYSLEKARNIMDLLSDDDIDEIRKRTEKGGVIK